jgi:ABC-type transport system substrate-binding protein
LAILAAASVAFAADPAKRWHGILAEDAPGFDPSGPSNTTAASVEELIFDRLFTYDYLARPAKLVPLAAEAMPAVSDGGKTWTVKLRKNITFASDPAFKGARRELTAADVVYTFKRFMDPAQRSPYQFMMRNKLLGLDDLARAAKGGKLDYDTRIPGIEALDRYTIQFRLTTPDYRFGYLLAHTATSLVAREVVDAYGADIGRHPVGTGPYVLTSWVQGTRAVLDANPGYRGFAWDFAPGSDPRDAEIVAQMRGKKMPQIGHIELSVIEEDTTYWLTFLRGDLDTVNLLPRFQSSALVGDMLAPDLAAKGLSIYRATPPTVSYTAFNFRDPVVGGFTPEKAALRRAIALAYKGDDLVHVVFHDDAVPAQMPIPPGVTGYDAAYRTANTYDPELANRLLDRFGYKRGADGFRTLPDGKPLELARNTYTGGAARDEDLIWQKSMERIGLRIRMEVLTGAETAKRLTTCTTMLYSANWSADYPDGENFMQLLYGPNSNESNAGCYRSDAYDQLYLKAEALPDGPERNRLFIAMARQADVDTAWVLGVYQRRIVVLQPWVIGHKTHPFLYSVLPYIDVKPH